MKQPRRKPIAKVANPAKLAPLQSSIAGIGGANPEYDRDSKGRFLTGNIGGGRPKGAKNRLTDVVMSAVTADFEIHGAEAISRVRSGDPVAYLKLVTLLVPRELVLQREREPAVDFAEISLGDWIELLDRLKREAAMKAQLLAAEQG